MTGTVLLDRAPLTDGEVTFATESGYVASAPLDSQGHFRLVSQFGAGIPLGSYRVAVLPPAREPSAEVMSTAVPLASTRIPEKYHYIGQSGLAAEVDGTHASFVFELSSAK